MIEFIKSLLKKLGISMAPSIEKATAGLTSALKQLEETVEHHANEAIQHSAIARAALSAKSLAEEKLEQAETIAKNVKALLGK